MQMQEVSTGRTIKRDDEEIQSMIMEEREVLSFLISCCVLIFISFHWPKIARFPHAKILLICFVTLFASWAFSVVEDLFWKEKLNFLQHLCSGLSGVILAFWLRAVSISKKEDKYNE